MPPENQKVSNHEELFLRCIRKLAEVNEQRHTHPGLKCTPKFISVCWVKEGIDIKK